MKSYPTITSADHPHTSRLPQACNPLLMLVFFLLCAPGAMIAEEEKTSPDKAEAKPNPSRIIQYRGPMPPLPKKTWGGEVALKFELYRSPTGGTPFWTESRPVSVGKDGWVAVDLGEVAPLPDEAFTTPFRFLSIWHQGEEFFTRKQIASLAYVASDIEKGLSEKNYKKYVEDALVFAKAAATKAPGREHRLDKLVSCGSFSMETHPRLPGTWLQAVETAGRLDARLPTFEEWYGAYDGKPGKQLVAMQGHYEWVIPWVYEPSIHARFHELYRGKPAACYYNELSPLNDYPFRLVKEAAPRANTTTAPKATR